MRSRPADTVASRLAKAFAVTWAAPCSAIGLLLGWPLMLACGGRWRRSDHTLEISAGQPEALALDGIAAWRAAWLNRLPFHAITLGHVVLGVSPEALARLRDHERVHVRQYERWGAVFLLAYPAASLLAWCRGGCVYRDNWFEREAYDVEIRALRVDGTLTIDLPSYLREEQSALPTASPLGKASLLPEHGAGLVSRGQEDTAGDIQQAAGGPHLHP